MIASNPLIQNVDELKNTEQMDDLSLTIQSNDIK